MFWFVEPRLQRDKVLPKIDQVMIDDVFVLGLGLEHPNRCHDSVMLLVSICRALLLIDITVAIKSKRPLTR